jgi:hypothetical protein
MWATLTFKILKNDISTVLHRSVVRSAADTYHQSKWVSSNPDVQETISKSDMMPSNVPRNSDSKQKNKEA